jgi:hypothetical protein
VLVVLVVVIGGLVLFRKPAPLPQLPPPDTARVVLSDSVPPPDTTPPPAPEPARLTVRSEPAGARVYIDGRAQAMRSNATFRGLKAGRHRVRVEMEGYETQRKWVTLEPGRGRRVSFTLRVPVAVAPPPARDTVAATPPAPPPRGEGTLEVTAKPFASIYVDGRLVQENMALVKVNLINGPHKVRATHPTLGTHEWSVTIRPGRTTELSHDFLATSAGTLRVTSGSVWARVFLNDEDTGKTTPCVLEGLVPGDYTLTLVREGYEVQGGARSVTVRAGQASEEEFTLEAVNE